MVEERQKLKQEGTPFRPGWWGTELPGGRPRVGTYGLYPHQNLPPLPFDFQGDFAWLASQPTHKNHIAGEKSAENKSALAKLLSAQADGVHRPPNALVKFFSVPELQRRIRSCTDCYLDLSSAFVPCPNVDGFLLRFLADSQGCVFWYVFRPAAADDHCVVASPDFYGTEDEQWDSQSPDPAQIIFCEQSFERFLCRFWLENEIWYADHEKRPMMPLGQKYLEFYGLA